ncbi:hypothetical protein [Robertkochia sediminum]|uniref:hypothetical protein n=1 Tax=Robertkochia sediminum TaxID=2785326 RepID=UPI0019333C75|nr:hypothetical protein [Robertkochia sediminum]MBL7471386.1 hypothetical protein [Robertkochia sediminum]
MRLLFEKEFLDQFYLDLNEENPSQGQAILLRIIKVYPELEWGIDASIESPRDLEALYQENPLLRLLGVQYPPSPYTDLKTEFERSEACRQLLIFAVKEHDWFSKAREQGALCFTSENYDQLLMQIVQKTSLRFDLFEPFAWSAFKNFADIPFKEIIVADNYIVSDKSGQKVDDNLVPMLQELLSKKESTPCSVAIYTKDFNPIREEPEKVKEKAKKVHSKLNRVFARHRSKFKLYSTDKTNFNTQIHDRQLLTNYFMAESGVGFNLIPHKPSNSEIKCDSIFDLYTYKRMKRLFRMFDEFNNYQQKRETLQFVSYP